jgi:PncC family amidohydrolase
MKMNEKLADAIIDFAKAHGMTVAVAESCSAGRLAQIFSKAEGGSKHFLGGVVAYTKQTKTRVLAVPSELVEEGTAVCGPVAEAMARGVAILLKADLGVAITGVAGPEPDEDGNPVGLVYCGVASKDGRSRHVRLDSTKREPEAINEEACHTALCLLRDFCAV